MREKKNITYQIIDLLGGVVNLSVKLGISEPAIYKWIRHNRIPSDHILEIYYDLLAQQNAPVGLDELCHHMRRQINKSAIKENKLLN